MDKSPNIPKALDPCGSVGEQLSAYLDGELSPEEAAAVEAHLRDCPDCARLCTALRMLRTDLASAQLEPPPALHGRIMAAMRRENRMRRIRRFTALATAGVAAMFCFVVIGGAILRGGLGVDNVMHDAAMPEMAKAADDENAVMYALADNAAAMTGASIDTTIVVEPTIAGTGLEHEAGVPAEQENASAEVKRTGPIAASPAPVTTAAAETVAETKVSDLLPVVSIFLAEDRRDLARVTVANDISSLSTETGKLVNAAPSANQESRADKPLLPDLRDARLAEEQLGTFCVVEINDGLHITYAVYDLITGKHLSLGDFLAVDAMPTLLMTLGAAPETAYRPTADGLLLLLPGGDICVRWNECPELEACVERYGMMKEPLCGE